MKVVIKEAQAAARLFAKEAKKVAGADGEVQDAEKRATYAKDRVIGKALYRFEDAMFQSHWGGNDALTKVTAADYKRAADEGVKQLKAIDTYKAHGKQIGNGDGIVTEKEMMAYPRTKNKLPIMAQTLVDFMIAAKKDGRL